MERRKALRGTAIVASGAMLLAVSLAFEWADPDVTASDIGISALLLPLAVAALALVIVARARSDSWPFLYTRVIGACALVGILWAALNEGSPVRFGVLLAALGAAMIVSGSSAALSPHAETEAR